MGSGFVVGGGLVITAAHVVHGASSVTVQSGPTPTEAHVVAVDKKHDSAAVRVVGPASKTAPLTLTEHRPAKGSTVGILGYPLNSHEVRVSTGVVSGLDESVGYGGPDDISAEHSYVTDAPINPGNSGGPVLDESGRVIGLVTGKTVLSASGVPVSGIGYVVPSRYLNENLSRWRVTNDRVTVRCPGEQTPPDSLLDVSIQGVNHAAAPGIARTLQMHGEAINSGRFREAWEFFTPEMQKATGSFEGWKSNLENLWWRRVVIVNVYEEGAWTMADVRLRTQQDAAHGTDGQTCSEFLNTYRMTSIEGDWHIDRVKARHGPPKPCLD